MTELEQIYLSALRYGLGRTSYITEVIAEFLMKQKLTQYCKNLMIRDIEECDDLGHECDRELWIKLLNHLKVKKANNLISKK